jgi:hypothetical protein
VSKEELGSVFIDVGDGNPITLGSPDPSGSDGDDGIAASHLDEAIELLGTRFVFDDLEPR